LYSYKYNVSIGITLRAARAAMKHSKAQRKNRWKQLPMTLFSGEKVPIHAALAEWLIQY
jgi:hypothetical protein